MENLEQKIKALGKAVFALDSRWKYIACDECGLIVAYSEKPIIEARKKCWNNVIGDFDTSMKLDFKLKNWQELCFSREECEM